MIERSKENDGIHRDFIANFSHELRTPIHGILGLVNLLSMTPLDQEQRTYLEKIKDASASLLELFADTLDYSKILSGKMTIASKPFSITKTLMEVYNVFVAAAKLKNLSLEFEMAGDYDDQVLGDAKRLKQVLSNLVSNAIKYTDFGRVSVLVRPIQLDDLGLCLRFSVSDTGPGIPKERQDLLFDRFTSFSPPGTDSTGLGLSISKSIVDLMGGRIEIESDEGKGTTFHVTLTFDTLNAIAPKESRSVMKLPSFEGARILLAEDDATSAYMLEAFLLKGGAKVTVVSDGLKAIEALENEVFDMVFMDVNMPNLDGVKASKAIREAQILARSGRPVPIIAITAYAMNGDRERFIDSGMSDYLSKPVDLNAMGEKILEHLLPLSDAKTDSELFSQTLKALMDASGLDEETSAFVIKTYIAQSLEILNDVERALQAKDDQLPYLIHKLKGSSGNVRLFENMNLAIEAEAFATKGDISQVADCLRRFKRNILVLQSDFSSKLK